MANFGYKLDMLKHLVSHLETCIHLVLDCGWDYLYTHVNGNLDMLLVVLQLLDNCTCCIVFQWTKQLSYTTRMASVLHVLSCLHHTKFLTTGNDKHVFRCTYDVTFQSIQGCLKQTWSVSMLDNRPCIVALKHIDRNRLCSIVSTPFPNMVNPRGRCSRGFLQERTFLNSSGVRQSLLQTMQVDVLLATIETMHRERVRDCILPSH